MSLSLIVVHVVGIAAVFVLGWSARRYALKRNPEAVAKLDAEAKALAKRALD